MMLGECSPAGSRAVGLATFRIERWKGLNLWAVAKAAHLRSASGIAQMRPRRSGAPVGARHFGMWLVAALMTRPPQEATAPFFLPLAVAGCVPIIIDHLFREPKKSTGNENPGRLRKGRPDSSSACRSVRPRRPPSFRKLFCRRRRKLILLAALLPAGRPSAVPQQPCRTCCPRRAACRSGTGRRASL